MKSLVYIVLIYAICLPVSMAGQIADMDSITSASEQIVSEQVYIGDSATAAKDTVPTNDSIAQQSFPSLDSLFTPPPSGQESPVVPMSADRPDQPIDFGARDSSYLDLSQNRIHLYGEAFVTYGKYNLKAGYIIFDFDDNEASAFDTLPSGLRMEKPDFTDGDNAFRASGLRYNFKSNKGLIYDAVTQEGEFTVLGSKTKFVSADADTMSTADQIYNKNAVITTCTNPIPHYGIRSTKLKVVPNRLAVAGLSQLELSGIPTPVVLPFGFYPLVDGLSSGLIFPADFDSNPALGLGLRGVGYYFPISDYMDLTVTGDFYTRGTHRLKAVSNFKKRYKYTGRVELQYANNIVENPSDLSRVSNKGFALKVSRNQDTKAHPYRSLSGSINISTGNLYSVNFNDFENATKQTYTSNFKYQNKLPGIPALALTVGLSHNQNTKTGVMNITLPDAKLTMTTIFPFKRKIPSSTEKWYEKININGSSALKGFVSTTDSTLFTQETIDKIETGIYNRATASASFKFLKHFNISPSINADQYLVARTLKKEFDDTLLFDTLSVIFDQDSMIQGYVRDTTFGQVTDGFANGFDALHKVNTSVSINTQIFGTKTWSKGKLRGLRHTMKPSVSFNYSPSTLDRQISDLRTIDPSVPEEDRLVTYNPFRGGAFNPSLNAESMSMRFGVVNNFEGKYYSKKDSTVKKFKFFREIRINTDYNFAKDSINWSPLQIRGNTKLTKFTQLNFNAEYDFYVEKNGRLSKQTIWSQKKRPFEFDNFNLTLITGFTIKDIFNVFSKKSKSKDSNKSKPKSKTNSTLGKSFLETLQTFRVDHNFRVNIDRLESGKDTVTVATHTLRFKGNIDLTPKWKVVVQNIEYNFVRKKFNYPAFTLSRDLHCWEMNFSWYPASGVYGFHIGVKSSTLSFLKYNYGQQNTNNLGFGR